MRRKGAIVVGSLVLLGLWTTGALTHAQLLSARSIPPTSQPAAKHTADKPASRTAQTTLPNGHSTPNPTACAANDLAKNVIISISQRHLWACTSTTTAYDSPVVTGQQKLAADLTPTGTYHIYSKQTNLSLQGSDSTGSWDDPVSYWLPFLSNQYGIYGFHDATWRPASDFGHIDPNSNQGSHGCVELPLATAAWLYEWAPVGTTVTITS